MVGVVHPLPPIAPPPPLPPPPPPPPMTRSPERPVGPSGFAVYGRLPPNFILDHGLTLDMPDNFLIQW